MPDVTRLFTRIKPPYLLVPKGGRKIAARVARDLTEYLIGVCEGYNSKFGTSYEPAEIMRLLLDRDVNPQMLFDEYRGLVEQGRAYLSTSWMLEKNWGSGWRFMSPEWTRWFIWNVLDKPCRIDETHEFRGAVWLKKVLVEHPHGEKWLASLVDQLRVVLYPSH